MDCLFCKIINKEIPGKIVYQDELVIALNDINPVAPEHILIIPRQHIPTINDLQPENNALIGHLFQVAKNLAKSLNFYDVGYRLVMNCNLAAGQTVFHIHLHLLGGRQFKWPPG